MEIKASDVKELRQKTGAGMMDCKKALTEAGGDFAKAEKILKELGLAAAAKRGGKATNEGRVFTSVGADRAAMVELSCETDFVARNEDFVKLGQGIAADMASTGKAGDSAEYANQVQDAMTTIKENMAVKRGMIMEIGEGELVSDYIHGDSGTIGVLVKVKADKPELVAKDEVKQFAFDVALHVAAFRPTFLSAETADKAYVAEQQEIFTAQAKQLGKPDNVTEGIAKGKLNKHMSEISLLEQGFVRDEKTSVAKTAANIGKDLGGKIEVTEFAYYMVGDEG
jgi:elongation factor Ts